MGEIQIITQMEKDAEKLNTPLWQKSY